MVTKQCSVIVHNYENNETYNKNGSRIGNEMTLINDIQLLKELQCAWVINVKITHTVIAVNVRERRYINEDEL